MADTNSLGTLFQNIANAIRSATGATAKYKPTNFSKVISDITNRGAWSSTINAGQSVTIPAGYHNGSGKVSASAVINLGTGTSFDCTSISGYQSLTADNFYIKAVSGFNDGGWTQVYLYNNRDNGIAECYLTKSYDASTGVLTAYVKYHYDYYDSNFTHTRSYNKNLPVTVVCIK